MEFTITIHGKGGHGSRPDRSCNPIECFSPVYAAIQQLPGGFTITKVAAGNANNIIPNDLHFMGSCAQEDAQQLKNILESICPVYHCTYEFN